jgi:hypothetical protein
MAPIDDDTLDRLLGRHLSSRLDGQLGRAEAAFRQSLKAAPSQDAFTADDPASRPAMRLQSAERLHHAEVAGRPPARSRWSIGLSAGLAAAAGMAAVYLIPGLRPTPPQSSGGGVAVVATRPADINRDSDARITTVGGDRTTPAVRYVHNRSFDEGTQTDDAGRPVRRVRHVQVERMQWYDPERKALIELTVPRENVELYELDTY